MKNSLFSKIGNHLRNNVSNSGILLLSFLIIIFLGTFLLCLPITHVSGAKISFLDSLFTATSATCVTGLMTIVAGTDLNLFGQIVVLLMIQVGGLGLMTFVGLFIVMSKNRLDYNQQNLLQSGLNKDNLHGIGSYILSILKYTAAFELIGFVMIGLFLRPSNLYEFFQVLFLSISAFCNAGIDVFGSSSLLAFQSNVGVNVVVCCLIILGGLGFAVAIDLYDCASRTIALGNDFKFFRSKLSVHTKIAIMMTLGLIVSGMVIILIFEWNNALSGFGFGNKLLLSFFNSVTLRTAGFYTFDYGVLNVPTKFVMVIYMLIGANPGGTAGGIKTTTIFLIIYGIYADLKGKKNIHIFGRHIHKSNFIHAVTVFMMYLMALFAGVTLMSCVDELPFIDILFEASSAIGTVGLSTGITTILSSFSKVIIILLMFIGRTGPITVFVGLHKKSQNSSDERVRYPSTDILVG